MKKNAFLLAIFFLWLLPSGDLSAKERRGARVSVLKNDRTIVEGELIAVKRDSTLLLDSINRESIALPDINIIKVVRASKYGVFILTGSLAGGVTGRQYGQGFDKIDNVALGAVFGAIAGFVVGSVVSQPGIFQIAGTSEKEVQAAVNKLRSMARFPSYQ